MNMLDLQPIQELEIHRIFFGRYSNSSHQFRIKTKPTKDYP